MKTTIDCPESLLSVIRQTGIIPFFKNPVTGWSVQEMTARGCWFDEDGVLGPWDWKIEAVHDGIAYGKFLGGRAAFATEEWYRELMNYRRSLPKYRVALGEKPRKKSANKHEELLRILAKPALDAIRESGALGSKQLRSVLSQAISPSQLKSLGAQYRKLLSPTVKKSVSDNVLTYLQMGTWTLTGDIERVYRGPNLSYSGWQLSSNTTPELFWGETVDVETDEDLPPWAKLFMEEPPVCPPKTKEIGTPEESRIKIVNHVLELFPEAGREAIEKLV